jgi:hypothetical protein
MKNPELEELISKCIGETSKAARAKYSPEEAERTAALFIEAQMKASLYIEDIELNVKLSRNEIERIEGEKYFEYRSGGGDKRITENALSAHIASDKDVCKIKDENARLEATLRKWTYIIGTLKDGHIFFRNVNKTKSWQE